MSTESNPNGKSELAGAALLEARLARSTLFADTKPHLKTVTVTTNPAPLGFLSFGVCACLYMARGLLLEWIPPESAFAVYTFFIFFAGLGELIVGLTEYRRQNVFAFNAFLCYSSFWLTFAVKGICVGMKWWPKSPKVDQMAFILYGFLTIGFWLQTLVLHLALSVLFLALTILFFVLAAEATHPSIRTGAGAWGLVVAFLAWYNGVAVLFIEHYGKEVLPLGHNPLARWQRGWHSVSRRFGPVGTRLALDAHSPSASDIESPPASPTKRAGAA